MNGDYPIDAQTSSLNPSRPHSISLSLAFAVFLTGILYYCFAYLLRIYPSVMMHDLLGRFHISAGSFGVLTSFYYFAYAPMQLPVGLSVDKIGPRKSLLAACCVSIAGVFMFASSHVFAFALLGRFLIGFGCAFSYVTALKIATIWLPRKYFATATGAVTGAGMVAAIFTDMYLTHVVQTTGYVHALYFPLITGGILLALIFIMVRDKPSSANASASDDEAYALSFAQLNTFLKLITKNPQMWLIGLIGAFLYMPSTVFLDLWGIPFLKTVYHLSAENAALGISVMLTGWICSSFATGALSDLLGTRKLPLVFACFGSTFIISLILFLPSMSHTLLFTLLFLLGAFCGPHPLCFTLSKENNPHHISGTAIAFANFLIMMGGFVFQPIVGKLLDFGWQGTIVHGIRVYTPSEYIHALSILPVCLLFACVLSMFLNETYGKAKQ